MRYTNRHFTYFLLTNGNSNRSKYRSCASGCVVECQICNREVVGSNLSLGYFASRSPQPSIPSESVNEYQLRLGRQRQVWLIPTADERVGAHVKLWNPLRTRAIPERFCGCDSVRRGIYQVYAPLPLPLPLPLITSLAVSTVLRLGERRVIYLTTLGVFYPAFAPCGLRSCNNRPLRFLAGCRTRWLNQA